MILEKEKFAVRLILWLFLFLFVSGVISAQEITVRITRTAGPVEVRKGDSQKWVRVEAGSTVKTGDSLRTLKGGKAQLVFPQNVIVLIKENSVLNLKDLRADGSGRVKTLVGSFLFDLKKALSPGSSFEVETPSALAVVRGTKFGDDVGLDGTTVFTGYEDTVDIMAQGISKTLEQGFEITVRPGEPPGEPEASEKQWEEDIFTAEDVELPTAEEYLSQLSLLETQYTELANTVTRFYEEFRRYELEGDVPRMSSVFYNVQPYRETFDRLNSQYEAVKDTLSNDPYYRGFVMVGGVGEETEAPSYKDESGSRMRELVLVIDNRIGAIQSAFDYIYEQMDEYVPSLEDVLDLQRGTIESRDPERDIRYGTLDTDNDGVPDVVETALGIEPGSEEAVIQLISPDDGAEFFYPDDESILFEFYVSDETYFTSFELVLSAGGISATKTFSGSSMDLSIPELISGPPSFASLFEENREAEFSWFVRGNFDFETFTEAPGIGEGGETASIPHHASTLQIQSETRTFVLNYGAPTVVDLSLETVGPDTVTVGEFVTVRLNFGEIAGLTEWEIAINYDPILLEFDTGRKTGLTGGSTLFFGESAQGVATVSGSVPQGASPISGSGPFAELVFLAREQGVASLNFGLVELRGIGGEEISTGALSGVDITVTP